MFRAMVQINDGDLLLVAHRDSLEEAARLIEELSTYWPRKYVVLDSSGNEVDFAAHTTIGRERNTSSPVSQL
jgi:hypothetical protein